VKPEEILAAALEASGILHYRFISGDRLRSACSALPESERRRYGLDAAGGAAIVGLAYCEDPARGAAAAAGPIATIGRFARANWYGELLDRLQAASARARAALAAEGAGGYGSPRRWRRLVNSTLPEKRLALESGLGRLGRHCLVMLPGPGSAFVLGLLTVPFALPDGDAPSAPRSAPALDPDCEGCGACVAACPTGALSGDGSLDRERCLQHWSSLPGPLPPAVEAAWGALLYGCDACQEACPRFRPDPGARTGRGILGPSLGAASLAKASDGELAELMAGSALGMAWIAPAALRRNAALAAALAPGRTLSGEFPPTGI
jgi:epoxyqueuosine reductase